jgi:hypothetical protein
VKSIIRGFLFYVSNKSGLWSRINKQWSGNNIIHKTELTSTSKHPLKHFEIQLFEFIFFFLFLLGGNNQYSNKSQFY